MPKEIDDETLEEIVRKSKGDMLTMIHDAGSGHPGGSLSIVRVEVVYYYRFDKGQPCHLSKGHAVPASYAVLHQLGKITDEQLSKFREVDGLEGHANIIAQKIPSGSLGQGASAVNGYALAEKLNGTNRKIYGFFGDGEIQEGQIWEGFMTAGNQKLNVCYVIDNNKKQLSGSVADIKDIEPLGDKLRAFKIKVVHCENTIKGITNAFYKAESYNGAIAVILNSKKGDGISFMENEVTGYHGKPLSDGDYEKAMKELNFKPTTFRETKKEKVIDAIVVEAIKRVKEIGCYGLGEKATRDVYREWLLDAGEKYPEIVVLAADLSESVRTDKFAKKYPKRFFEIGIAEQDMLGTAMGLSASGKVPFVSTFSVFSRKFHDSLRIADYANLNIKYVLSHAELIGEDGASHQDTEDLGIWLSLYNVKVIGNPADQFQAKAMLEHIINLNGPCYVRLGRPNMPNIYSAEHKFEPGKADILRQGKDISIITTGQEVFESLIASEILRDKGIGASVINVSYFKPFDEDTILDVAEKTKKIYTVEAHNPTTGLFSLVCQALAKSGSNAKVIPIGTNTYVGSGSIQGLKEKYGLSALRIAERVYSNR